MIILKSDLEKCKNELTTTLTAEIEDSITLKNSINNFIALLDSNQSKLSGEIYQTVKNKMNTYQNLAQKRTELATELLNKIQSANNQMINFMEEYGTLDDSEKDEVEDTIRKMKTSLSNLEAEYYKKTWLKRNVDELLYTLNPEKYSTYGLKNQIENIKVQITELSKELEKLKNLSIEDTKAYNQITTCQSTINSSYKTTVESIKRSSISTSLLGNDNSQKI